MTSSSHLDLLPVAQIEPTSSLSTSTQPQVRSGVIPESATSINAINEVHAQTRSSCPYPPIIDLPKPTYVASPAGTTSNSAETKSSSSIRYWSFRSFKIFFFTIPLSSSFSSIFIAPNRRSNFSPSIGVFLFSSFSK